MSNDILLKMKNLRIEARVQDEEVLKDGVEWAPIVHGVDLELRRGEVMGLIGESGAGKSTIGLAAMGYARYGCRLASGSVKLDGQELIGAPHSLLMDIRGKKVAYVAQSAAASFNPAHTLYQQVCEGPVWHGVSDLGAAMENARKLFAKLQLPNPETFGERYPHQVSGGQLQRAMTAMALSCQPDLIVFDEPTTALDVTTQIEVLATIKEAIREYNTAALYITHDLAVVAQVTDRIKVLRHGREVEEGTADKIINDPDEEYTRQLVNVHHVKGEHDPIIDNDHEPVLSLKNVSAAYTGSAMVVKNIDLDLAKGTTMAVVGESGSGKSTLARVITGLLPPVEGSVVFQGEEMPLDYRKRTKDQLRRLQMIYQMADTAMNPRQKIGEIIGRPLEFYFGLGAAERRKRVEELLEMIELPADYADRFPAELSGGQKQRICIARALAAEPEMIICDEVTSALDPLVANGILELLLKLQEKTHVSYLFITHDLATVKAIADSITVMYQGEVVEQGPKPQVLAPPHHDYTHLLLSSVPEMELGWLERVLSERRMESAGN